MSNSFPQEERLRWWKLSLDGDGEAHLPIFDYAIWILPSIEFADKAVKALALRLDDCPANSPMQFRAWCRNQLDRLAKSIDVREFRKKEQRRAHKPLAHERDGDNCIVRLFDAEGTQHLWRFPASWLDSARRLGDVHIRHYADGRPYVARKTPVITADCKRTQKITPVHRLFLGLSALRHEAEDNLEAVALDGNWLNFTGGNLFLAHGKDILDREDEKARFGPCPSLDKLIERESA